MRSPIPTPPLRPWWLAIAILGCVLASPARGQISGQVCGAVPIPEVIVKQPDASSTGWLIVRGVFVQGPYTVVVGNDTVTVNGVPLAAPRTPLPDDPDPGPLIISSHGSKNSVSVEPFDSEKDRDAKYNKYINDGTFTKDEIVKTSNDDSFAISVTDKFIEKYRDVGQALVYISACEGGTLADDFTDAREQAATRLARVALGGNSVSKVAAYTEYATRFFKDLDGQERTGKAAADRLKLRAVKASMEANNEIARGATEAALRVEFSLTGNGDTTLAPIVKEGADICVASPLKAGDKITFTFDTNCDTAAVPTVQAAGGGVTLGAPAWKTGSQNVLEVPVTAPAVGTTTFKITLKGDTVKALKNEAKLDGNTNPDKVNGQGPATHKDKADDYVIEFKDGKRVH